MAQLCLPSGANGKSGRHHFSQANPKGVGQEDVPELLVRVARSIKRLGSVHVHDITFHDEVDDKCTARPTMTVYYDRSKD